MNRGSAIETTGTSMPARPVVLADVVAITLAFAVSRVAYYLAGVRFDTGPLGSYWQYIDPALLRDRLGESLLYLHSQPPLFNLWLGGGVKLGPEIGADFFAATFLLLGLVNSLAIFGLMRELEVDRKFAYTVIGLHLVNPTPVLYESYLFYTLPVQALLTSSAWCLARFVARPRLNWLATYLVLTASLALTRASFHLLWLAIAATLPVLVTVSPQVRRRTGLASAIAVLCVGCWYAKNLSLFGTFSASSWLGMNLAKTWHLQLTDAERGAMAARGEISEVSTLWPLSPVDDYRPFLEFPAPTGIAVLDDAMKSSGSGNRNHIAYLDISSVYLRDSMRLFFRRPVLLLRSQASAWAWYFLPASEYALLDDRNVQAVQPFDLWFRRAYYLQLGSSPDGGQSPSEPRLYYRQRLAALSLTIVIGTMLVLILLPPWVARLWPVDRARALLLTYLWLGIAWVAVTGNMLELYENHRLRFESEPLLTVAFAALIFGRLRHARHHGSSPRALRLGSDRGTSERTSRRQPSVLSRERTSSKL